MTNQSKSIARYDTGAIHLHWLIAVLVLCIGAVGLLFEDMPKAVRPTAINLHAIFGLLFFALVIFRIFWRATHTPPPLPADVDAFSRKASHPLHMLMYAIMLTIPPLGIIAFVWHGRAFNFGLFTIDFGVKSDRAIFHPAEDYHGWLVYALFALVALHALAALWHHFIRRDDVLRRMWPGPRV